MAGMWPVRLLCVVLLLTPLLVSGEIHRAKALKVKLTNGRNQHQARSGQPDPQYESERYQEEPPKSESLFLGHAQDTWLYSILASTLVGLSGILPLAIIPIEVGKSLRHGAPAARLKLLLSFAVGGLLGDVFLHLLPEAWAHLEKEGPDGHTKIGLWVLAGLLSFLILEKIFPDQDDDEDDDEDNEVEEQVEASEALQKSDRHQQSNASSSPSKPARNGVVHRGDKAACQNGTNGHIANGYQRQANGHVASHAAVNGSVATKKAKAASTHPAHEGHIKTSGWLNLMANVIDNFTHGLAVAGSFCVSNKTGVLTTFAILLHEIPHEIGDFAILLRAGFDRWKAAKCQLLTATGGLLGALAALTAESAQAAGDRTAWILPFTSGGFIYIALVTIVPDLLTEKNTTNSIKQVLLLCSGIVVMAFVTVLAE